MITMYSGISYLIQGVEQNSREMEKISVGSGKEFQLSQVKAIETLLNSK